MSGTFSEILKRRSFLKHLVLRELRHRYAGSWLGPLWAFVHPLFLMTVYLVVFSWILGPRVTTDLTNVSFGMFLVSGFIPWLSIQDTVMRSTTVMSENAPLIRQNAFPMVLLPLQVVIIALINQLFLAVVFAVICLACGTVSASAVIWLFAALLLQVMLLSGLAMLISVISPVFRDIGEAVQLLLTVGFFATPIVYPLSAVPDGIARVLRLNPMFWVVSLYRQAFLNEGAISGFALLYTLGVAGAVLGGGHLIFKRLRTTVADVL